MIGLRCLGALAGAALLLAGTAAAQTLQKVKLGVSGRPDQAALELALHRGYFTAQGLDVETVQASSGMDFVSSLAADQLQVASGSANAGLFNALVRGIDIKIVADFAHIGDASDRTVAIVARADLMDSGAIKTAADLKGRVLARGPGPGMISGPIYEKLLERFGIAPGDVTFRYLAFPDSIVALSTKNVDAAYLIEPLVTQAEQQGIGRVLATGGAIYPGAELSVVYYSPAFAKRTDAATKFMVAYLRGERDYHDAFFLNKGRAEAIKLLTEHTAITDPKAWETVRQVADLDGRVNLADLKSQAAYYKQQGLISAVPDLDKIVDPQFAEAAVKILATQ
jgi:NitT/TauT family transport system substrate-binding protein